MKRFTLVILFLGLGMSSTHAQTLTLNNVGPSIEIVEGKAFIFPSDETLKKYEITREKDANGYVLKGNAEGLTGNAVILPATNTLPFRTVFSNSSAPQERVCITVPPNTIVTVSFDNKEKKSEFSFQLMGAPTDMGLLSVSENYSLSSQKQ